MRIFEKTAIIIAFIIMVGLSIWLQIGLLEDPKVRPIPGDTRHDPDYYVENFTATGVDETGENRYVLEAERMVHFPDDDTALLDKPHIIQYKDNEPPRHSYSDSGWVAPGGNEVLLTGNVRVIEGHLQNDAGGIMTTESLKIKLKDNDQ